MSDNTSEQIVALDRLSRDLKAAAATMSTQEARYLVDLYYQMQENRIRAAGQIRAMTTGESPEPHQTLAWVMGQGETLETSIKNALGTFAKSRKPGAWAQSIVGIGPVISAGLLAHIDVQRCGCPTYCTMPKEERPAHDCKGLQTVGHVYSYAGLAPGVKWGKGEKRPWNASLKVLCWKIGQSFVKQSGRETDFYGKVYLNRKALEAEKNERKEYADQAARILTEKKISKDTEAYKSYSKGFLPKGHLQQRAERYAVKLFLSHYHEVAYFDAFGVKPPPPYAIGQLGHVDVIPVPNWPFTE